MAKDKDVEMISLDELKARLAAHKEELRRRDHVKEIGIFGSYVRGEENPKSDVDILVDFEEPIGMFAFLELEEYLGEILGARVDLVSRKALKPNIEPLTKVLPQIRVLIPSIPSSGRLPCRE